MSYLVMYSMLSYMADRQTMSDLVIKEYHAKLTKMMSVYNEFPTMQKLEYDTYYLIVLLMSNIKNYDGLTQLNSFIKRANDSLNEEMCIRDRVGVFSLDLPGIIFHKFRDTDSVGLSSFATKLDYAAVRVW